MRRQPLDVDCAAKPMAVCLYADGGMVAGELTTERRGELIAALNAGRHVEAEVEIMAYRQTIEPGTPLNTHGVRIRSGGMAATARSGRDLPFMRDHRRAMEDRGGTVLGTRLERADGEERLYQRVRLSAPWAVRQYLEGNLDRVSVGLQAMEGSEIHCTACRTDYRDCAHWPLEQVEGKVVEFEYQNARLRECSAVAFPSVTGTAVSGVSAVQFSEEFMAVIDEERADKQARTNLELTTAQIALREREATIKELTEERNSLAAKVKAAESERDKALAERDELQTQSKRVKAQAFLAQHPAVTPGSEMHTHLTDVYVRHGEEYVAKLMGGIVTTSLFTQQAAPAKIAEQKQAGSAWKPDVKKTADGKIDVAALLASAPPHVKERLCDLQVAPENAELILNSLRRSGSLERLAAKDGMTVEAF